MDFTNFLTLAGGLALFLFGMSVMSSALEKRAGNRLKGILARLTSNKFKGFLLGLAITAIIQSSSATTVMVVGFVNSGVMTLHQTVGVIMGANLGSSITSWFLAMTGIQSENFFINMLNPENFTPILALVGVIFNMSKDNKKKDIGLVMIGFSVLMFGMNMMSGAVEPLKDNPNFIRILTVFEQPVLGLLAGIIITAIIQSSAASVGILQALTITGSITNATAIPIIMGQNIGTCVSALISSIGANKNAKRAALIHLYFNLIAAIILLALFYAAKALFPLQFLQQAASPVSVALIHTVFKIIALAILMPFSNQLEKLATMTVRDSKETEKQELLDDRLLGTPAAAILRSKDVAKEMATDAFNTVIKTLEMVQSGYSEATAKLIYAGEDRGDVYEDKLGTYLVKISSRDLTDKDSLEVSKLLHIIGDLERLSDHAINIVESMQEIYDKKLVFSSKANSELSTMCEALKDILKLTSEAFVDENGESAYLVEPLEQVVDYLKSQIKNNHIDRLQKGESTIEQGFVLSDLLTNLERISDHCSNIAGCIIEISHNSLGMHEYLRGVKSSDEFFKEHYDEYMEKYAIAEA